MPKNTALKELTPANISPLDAVIAVMGPTGVGKSTFIDTATEQGGKTIGHTLESYTARVRAVKFPHPKTGTPTVFVDTPGFDDTHKSDTEVLRMIADWLAKTYKRKIKLAGIIYMHRISDNRMAGAPHKNLHVFADLCGDAAIPNVILVTTMWDRVKDDVGSRRETELAKDYWKTMLDKGSSTMRFDKNFQSAWEIVDRIVVGGPAPHAVLLQKEMVELHRRLSETKAGITLYNELQDLLSLQREAFEKLKQEAEILKNPQLAEDFQAQYEEVEAKIRRTFDQIEEMRIPLWRRMILILPFIGRRGVSLAHPA